MRSATTAWNCPKKKARVILVHPAQAHTELCGNPSAYQAKSLCCFPASQGHFPTEQTAIWWAIWILGTPLCHIVSTPCPLPQQSLHCGSGRTRFKKWVTPMNVHFHFRAQWAGIIPDTEPWLTGVFFRLRVPSIFHCEKKKKKGLALALLTAWTKVQLRNHWWNYVCQKDNGAVVNKNTTRKPDEDKWACLRIIHEWIKCYELIKWSE